MLLSVLQLPPSRFLVFARPNGHSRKDTGCHRGRVSLQAYTLSSDLQQVPFIAGLPGKLPEASTAVADIDPLQTAQAMMPKLAACLSDPASAARVLQEDFLDDCFWRDSLALCWTMRTFHGKPRILKALKDILPTANPDAASVKLESATVETSAGFPYVRAVVRFERKQPNVVCSAVFKLVNGASAFFFHELNSRNVAVAGQTKIWLVITTLEALATRPWRDILSAPAPAETTQYEHLPDRVSVLVIGGGHGGISMAARFKALGIDYAIVDNHDSVGDCWTSATLP